MVRASGEEVYELEVRAGFWARREGRKRDEYGGIFVDFCNGHRIQQSAIQRGEAAEVDQTFRYILQGVPRGVGEKQVLERDLDIRMVLPNSVEYFGRFLKG